MSTQIHLDIRFGPTDALNPESGYQVHITDMKGKDLLFTGTKISGDDLLSINDCIELIKDFKI